jgi:hypothetical protein
MSYKSLATGLLSILLFMQYGCNDDNNSESATSYTVTWQTNFLLPEGYTPFSDHLTSHPFRIDKFGNTYLSFQVLDDNEIPVKTSIWMFDGIDWEELPDLPQQSEENSQSGYFIPDFTNQPFTFIYFKDITVGVPWRATQTDSVFSTNRFDPGSSTWSEYTVMNEEYLDPNATYKLTFGDQLHAELLRYIQLGPSDCMPSWIQGCYDWDEEHIFLTLTENGWDGIDATVFTEANSEDFRVIHTESQTQLEIFIGDIWLPRAEALNGNYSLYVDKLKNIPYLYSGTEILRECDQGWCHLLDGYDLGQNPIEAIHIDLSDNIYIYQAMQGYYSIYKFSTAHY